MSGLDSIIKTELKTVYVSGGDVMHALKSTESDFNGFGEAYFSTIEKGVFKGIKKHKKMIMNLIVPIGQVRFIFFSDDLTERKEIVLGKSDYYRLTVPPNIWFGFYGIGEENLVLNISNILHDPLEVEKLDMINFNKLQL
jgi:dTDP-4-dehydrorhamnose 3,5-epimerase